MRVQLPTDGQPIDAKAVRCLWADGELDPARAGREKIDGIVTVTLDDEGLSLAFTPDGAYSESNRVRAKTYTLKELIAALTPSPFP